MKREYGDYFTSRYRRLRRYRYGLFGAPRFYPSELIEGLLRNIPDEWRPDAQFFLASNLFNMVILPYDKIQGMDSDLSEGGRVWNMILMDLRDLVERSEAVAKDRGRDYVSATSVATALGQLASDLRTTSLQIWGPTESG